MMGRRSRYREQRPGLNDLRLVEDGGLSFSKRSLFNSLSQTKSIFETASDQNKLIIRRMKDNKCSHKRKNGARKTKKDHAAKTDLEVWDGAISIYGMSSIDEELRLQTLVQLRNDYISRLKYASLPFAASESDINAEHLVQDEQLVCDLVNATRSTTIEIIERADKFRQKYNKTFLWEGKNILLHMNHDLNFLCHVPKLKKVLKIDCFRDNPFVLNQHKRDYELDFSGSKNSIDRIRNAQRIIEEQEKLHGKMVYKQFKNSWFELDQLIKRRRQRLVNDSKLARKLVPMLRSVTISGNSRKCFQRHDKDGDGLLSYKEFLRAVERLGQLPLTCDEEREWLTRQCDQENAQCISYDAFDILCLRARRGEICTALTLKKHKIQKTKKMLDSTSKLSETSAKQTILEEMEALSKRRCLLQEELSQVEKERCFAIDDNAKTKEDDEKAIVHTRSTRTSKKYEFASRPEIEVVKERKMVFESVIGELECWQDEIKQSILILWEKEAALGQEYKKIQEKENLLKEINQNQLEEAEMRRQEDTQKHREKLLRQEQLQRDKKKRQEEEVKYREKLRQKKRRESRERKVLEKRSATKIQCFLRKIKPKISLKLKKATYRQYQKILPRLLNLDSKTLFKNYPYSSGMRITPLIVLIQKNSSMISELIDFLPKGFWSFLSEDFILECADICSHLNALFANSSAVLVQITEINPTWIKLFQVAREGLWPRPLFAVSEVPTDTLECCSLKQERKIAALSATLLIKGSNTQMYSSEVIQVANQKNLPESTCFLVAVLTELLYSETSEILGNCLNVDRNNSPSVDNDYIDAIRNPDQLFGKVYSFDIDSYMVGNEDKCDTIISMLSSKYWPNPEYRQSPAITLLTDWVVATLRTILKVKYLQAAKHSYKNLMTFIDLISPTKPEILAAALYDTKVAYDPNKGQSLYICGDMIFLHGEAIGLIHLDLRRMCLFLVANSISLKPLTPLNGLLVKIASMSYSKNEYKDKVEHMKPKQEVILSYPEEHKSMPSCSEDAILHCGNRIGGSQYIVSISAADHAKYVSIVAINLGSGKQHHFKDIDQVELLGSKAGTVRGFEEILARLEYSKEHNQLKLR